jgi:acyl carrier protein
MAFDRTSDASFRSLEPDDRLATSGDALEELVCHVVAAHLEVDACDVRPGHVLEHDLGISRLGLVLIALDLEDLERVSMPFEALSEVRTVSDLARLLKCAPTAVH